MAPPCSSRRRPWIRSATRYRRATPYVCAVSFHCKSSLYVVPFSAQRQVAWILFRNDKCVVALAMVAFHSSVA